MLGDVAMGTPPAVDDGEGAGDEPESSSEASKSIAFAISCGPRTCAGVSELITMLSSYGSS